METEWITVDPAQPEPAAIQRAADVLLTGGLVAFPTETVYGLGADATNPEAVARIFEAKGRPPTNPTIIHVADLDAAKAYASSWPKAADLLAAAFWPGPLTIVVPAAEGIAPAALAGGTTVGLRVPAHPIALALLRAVNRPMAAPSANRSESLSPTTAAHVLRSLNDRIEMILNGGATTGGLESTVVDLSASPPTVLRPGLVSVAQLREFLPDLTSVGEPVPNSIPKSPGRLPRHYAPSIPLELVADFRKRIGELFSPPNQERRIGLVVFGPRPIPSLKGLRFYRLPVDPTEAAQWFYDVLHKLDSPDLERIIVQEPPDGEEWSAIRDRLQRASTPPERGRP